MGQLVDTSVWISLERLGRPIHTLFESYPDESVVIAAITASELLAGVHLADSSERRQEREMGVEAVFRAVSVEPFDLSAARVHARLWTELTSAGQMIGSHDLIIAATALAFGHAVVTHNVRDFGRVSGLIVREPQM
jgi:predicted nucleic acid-binding protein